MKLILTRPAVLIRYSFFAPPDTPPFFHSTLFAYDTDHSRYKRTDTRAGKTTTTRYLGNVEFISRPDGSSEVKRYINGNIIEKKVTQAGSNTSTASIQILLKDHLGSLHTIVNKGNMTVVQRMSFDPFGLRRSPTDWKAVLNQSQVNSLYGINNATTTRGFTGHEQLDEVGLIHMNGRVYDPKLGRFLQADPFVQYKILHRIIIDILTCLIIR